MSHSEHCESCHQERLIDTATHVGKNEKNWLSYISFERVLPVMLAILVIVSTVQTIELGELKSALKTKGVGVSVTQATAPVAGAPAAGGALNALPSQVGGC